MRITIRAKDVEFIYEEDTEPTKYPKCVTQEEYSKGVSKSERMMEVVTHLVGEALKLRYPDKFADVKND